MVALLAPAPLTLAIWRARLTVLELPPLWVMVSSLALGNDDTTPAFVVWMTWLTVLKLLDWVIEALLVLPVCSTPTPWPFTGVPRLFDEPD